MVILVEKCHKTVGHFLGLLTVVNDDRPTRTTKKKTEGLLFLIPQIQSLSEALHRDGGSPIGADIRRALPEHS